MKPSEALRKGMTMVKGHGKGRLYSAKSDTACALGCILIGQGIPKDQLFQQPVLEIGIKYFNAYGNYIEEDNDKNCLSLGQIAQRLEAIGE